MMTNSVANDGNLFGASDYDLNKVEILETGVEILEYDGGISYHGKCFVIDVDTSIAPEGKIAQEVSDGKNRLLQILKYFNWGRFIM
ncbi:MAG: hypothetical protein LIP11_18205 [Clostridiales bacterium]|nr:hypothetical protein [Clostridiales bacterium]